MNTEFDFPIYDGVRVTYTEVTRRWVGILKKISKDKKTLYLYACAPLDLDSPFVSGVNYSTSTKYYKDLQPSKVSEDNYLLDRMAMDRRRFDFEAKAICICPYVPKRGEYYFYISDNFKVYPKQMDNSNEDTYRINTFNCFQFKNEAEYYAAKFQNVLRGRHIKNISYE